MRSKEKLAKTYVNERFPIIWYYYPQLITQASLANLEICTKKQYIS